MKKIIIVTVNYNTEEDTKNFLKSLETIKIEDYSLETIIVDNGSTKIFQLSDSESKKKYKPNVMRLDENTGFSGGYNTGIQEALVNGADYILVVNNDTLVDSHMLSKLFEELDDNPEVGAVTPKIYFAKGHEFHKNRYKKEELGKVFWFAGGYFDWNNVQSVHTGVDEVDHGQYDTKKEIEFSTGCCMMIKREVFEKIGLFDDNFFLYYEDADLSMRIAKAGYKIMYVPEAILMHVNASSSGGAGNTLQDYFITRNQMLFGMKYAPIKSKIALVRQSVRLLLGGRPMQQKAIRDFYMGNLGKGSFFKNNG